MHEKVPPTEDRAKLAHWAFKPPVRPPVEESPGGNRHGQHFLEAEGLGTELHTVRVVSLGFPALELYGKRHPVALDVSENSSCYTLSYFAELDHVGLA